MRLSVELHCSRVTRILTLQAFISAGSGDTDAVLKSPLHKKSRLFLVLREYFLSTLSPKTSTGLFRHTKSVVNIGLTSLSKTVLFCVLTTNVTEI